MISGMRILRICLSNKVSYIKLYIIFEKKNLYFLIQVAKTGQIKI